MTLLTKHALSILLTVLYSLKRPIFKAVFLYDFSVRIVITYSREFLAATVLHPEQGNVSSSGSDEGSVQSETY